VSEGFSFLSATGPCYTSISAPPFPLIVVSISIGGGDGGGGGEGEVDGTSGSLEGDPGLFSSSSL
jgi:hypothetical protein